MSTHCNKNVPFPPMTMLHYPCYTTSHSTIISEREGSGTIVNTKFSSHVLDQLKHDYYHVMRSINRDLFVKAPWNAVRHIYIYLKKHETILGRKITSDEDLPRWLHSNLVFRISKDFLRTPELMHKFFSEMSKISESLVDIRSINRLVQSYVQSGRIEQAFSLILNKDIADDFKISFPIQPDLIIFSTIMDGFIRKGEFESALNLFSHAVRYLDQPSCPLRQNFDRNQINALLTKLIYIFNEMNEPDCSLFIYSFMMREHSTIFNKKIINSNSYMKWLNDHFEQLPDYVLEHVRPSANGLNTLISGLVKKGMIEKAYNLTKSSYDIQKRLYKLDGIDIAGYRVGDNGQKNEFHLINAVDIADRYTLVIQGYLEQGKYENALRVYDELTSQELKENHATMSWTAVRPQTRTVAIMVKAMSMYGEFEKALELIRHARAKYSVFIDVEVYNALLEGLLTTGQHEKAIGLFNEMVSKFFKPQRPNMKTNLIMVAGFAQSGQLDTAKEMLLFQNKLASGYIPSTASFNILLREYLKIYDLETALNLVKRMRLYPNVRPSEETLAMLFLTFATQVKYSSNQLIDLIEKLIPPVDIKPNQRLRYAYSIREMELDNIIREKLIESVHMIEGMKVEQKYSTEEMVKRMLNLTMASINELKAEINSEKISHRMERIDPEKSLEINLEPPGNKRSAKIRHNIRVGRSIMEAIKQKKKEKLEQKRAMRLKSQMGTINKE